MQSDAAPDSGIPCATTGIRISYTSNTGKVTGAETSTNTTGALGNTYDVTYGASDDLDPSPQTFMFCMTSDPIPASYYEFVLMNFMIEGGSTACTSSDCGDLSKFAVWINGKPLQSTFSYFPVCTGCLNTLRFAVNGALYQ